MVGILEEPSAFDFFGLTSTEKQIIGALAYNRSVVTGRKRTIKQGKS